MPVVWGVFGSVLVPRLNWLATNCHSWCLCWGSSLVSFCQPLKWLVLPVSLFPLMILTLPRKPSAGVFAVVLMTVYEWPWPPSFGLRCLPNCCTPTWEAKYTMWVHEERCSHMQQHIYWWFAYFCWVYCIRCQEYSFLANVCVWVFFLSFPILSVFWLTLIPTDSNWLKFCSSCV